MPFGLRRKKTAVKNVHVRLPTAKTNEIEKMARERGLSFAATVLYLLNRGLRHESSESASPGT